MRNNKPDKQKDATMRCFNCSQSEKAYLLIFSFFSLRMYLCSTIILGWNRHHTNNTKYRKMFIYTQFPRDRATDAQYYNQVYSWSPSVIKWWIPESKLRSANIRSTLVFLSERMMSVIFAFAGLQNRNKESPWNFYEYFSENNSVPARKDVFSPVKLLVIDLVHTSSYGQRYY